MSAPNAPIELVAASAAMRAVIDLIATVAPTTANVLITGESGTGKETVARAIHAASAARWPGPFVRVPCGALSPALLESELFGFIKTGYARPEPRIVPGAFEKAHGGTVYLSDPGDVPLPLQVPLLRVLQERRVQRVGGTESVDVDVRVIASTLRDLTALVRAGNFREDLYYRLNVVRIDLPPLRERPEDIPPLATHFAEKSKWDRRRPAAISQQAAQALASYPWPGNVRELENTVERACTLAGVGPIQIEHLPPEVAGA